MAGNRNICDCPNPPGGRAICEPDQLAICRIINGQAETECIDLRESGFGGLFSKKAINYLEKAYTEVTGNEAKLPGLVTGLTPEHIAMLKKGVYDVPDTGELVVFRIPDFVWELLESGKSGLATAEERAVINAVHEVTEALDE